MSTPGGGFSQTNMWSASTDGGVRWTRPQPVRGLTSCTGSTHPFPSEQLPQHADFTSEPHVSLGLGASAYMSADVVKQLAPFMCCGSTYVNRSRDGGLHWDAPVMVDQPDGRDDFPSVTADPRSPRRAYLSWDRVFPLSQIMFSTTSDAGTTWAPGSTVVPPSPGHLYDTNGAPVVVTSNGTLLLFCSDYLATGLAQLTTASQLVLRSRDGGRSWSPPATIAQFPQNISKVSVSAGPHGRVYLVWADRAAGTVTMVRSRDNGKTWDSPRQLVKQPGAQLAAVAVQANGTVGMTWYDNRRSADATSADAWFAHSRDQGATWTETHVAGPFSLDVSSFPSMADNPPLGGYEGLVPTSNGFATAFVMGRPEAATGPSDVFFARIRI